MAERGASGRRCASRRRASRLAGADPRRTLGAGRALDAALGLAVALLAACAPDFRPAARVLGQSLSPPREPLFERRRSYFDSAATQVSREHGVLIQADNSLVAEGRDVAWYSNGRLRYERSFARGEPRGRWRSWYENGVLESDATYEPGVLTSMTWWRDDGTLSSTGSHLCGRREGAWLSLHGNGLVASQGAYLFGQRHGPWIYLDELGQLIECGDYHHGERSGAWERGSGASATRN